MIFNLKDLEMNNYISWVYSILAGYEANGQLGSPKIVEVAGEDIDTYLTAGVYCFAAGYSPLNKPAGNTNGWLIVIPWQASGGTCKQIWLRHGTPADTDHSIYIRTRISGVWGEWYEVFTERSQGVYNLGAPIGDIPENSNLNNFKTVGIYTATGTGIAATIVNAPTTLNFKLVVENINSVNYILQTAISRVGKKWTRYYDKSSDTWGVWETDTLNGIKDITLNNNGKLVVTGSDGRAITFAPESLIG